MQQQLKQLEINLAEKKADIQKQIKEEIAKRDLQQQRDAEEDAQIAETIKREATKAENSRTIKQADYNLLKESFKDPIQRKMQTMEALGDLHGSMSFGSTFLHQMGDQEPVAEILDKFTRLAEQTND